MLPGEVNCPERMRAGEALPASACTPISLVRNPVPPTSAMLSMPWVARPPACHSETWELCTTPIGGEKCGLPGNWVGCVVANQVATNSTR